MTKSSHEGFGVQSNNGIAGTMREEEILGYYGLHTPHCTAFRRQISLEIQNSSTYLNTFSGEEFRTRASDTILRGFILLANQQSDYSGSTSWNTPTSPLMFSTVELKQGLQSKPISTN